MEGQARLTETRRSHPGYACAELSSQAVDAGECKALHVESRRRNSFTAAIDLCHQRALFRTI